MINSVVVDNKKYTMRDQYKIISMYLKEGFHSILVDLVLDRVDRFYIARAQKSHQAYKTRGNVVQRVNGVLTKNRYNQLLIDGREGIDMMKKEVFG